MDYNFDFKNLSPAEIEMRCRQAKKRKDALEEDLRRRETALKQKRGDWTQSRGRVQTLLEQLTVALLPDLSAPVKTRLARIFPSRPEVFQTVSVAGGFFSNLSAYFAKLFGGAKSDQLEEKRVFLRNVLWQLNQMPPNTENLSGAFKSFLQAKHDFFTRDQAINQEEAQANQIVAQVNELKKQLRRCDEHFHGRRQRRNDSPHTTDEPCIYQQSVDDYDTDYSDDSDSSNYSSSSTSYSSDSYSSDTSAARGSFEASSDSDKSSFSGFGGGGDFAGGGAGGSWENYS